MSTEFFLEEKSTRSSTSSTRSSHIDLEDNSFVSMQSVNSATGSPSRKGLSVQAIVAMNAWAIFQTAQAVTFKTFSGNGVSILDYLLVRNIVLTAVATA